MDNLTPKLNTEQLKQNIDALVKQGIDKTKIQGYIDNYTKDLNGNYILKGASNIDVNLSHPNTLQEKIAKEQLNGSEYIATGVKKASEQYQTGVNQADNATSFKDAIAGELKATGGLARGALRTVSGAIKTVLAPASVVISPIVSKGLELVKSQNPELASAYDAIAPKIQALADKHPETAKDINDIANIALLFAGGKASESANITKEGAGNAIKDVIQAPQDLKNALADTKNSIKTSISRSNALPTLETSTDRLHTLSQDATTKVESPIDLYNKYDKIASSSKSNVKADTVLGDIGTKDISKSVDMVIKQRREAGAQMGAEMKAIGNTKTDLTQAFPKFEQMLKDNGVTYNPNKKTINLERTSKITNQDGKLIKNYISELNTLGANPTAQELDAFLSRIPKEMEVFKADNNITGTTNAMRIIQGNLKDLSTTLSPETNPAFKTFSEAKAKYAQLSQFLDKANGLLGKKTSSGDFVKDASLLKASVNSIVGGGKKDLLTELENLTGNPILDKTIIGLQAMKDNGITQGASLLDILNPESNIKVPTSKAGIIDRTITSGVNAVKKRIVGSPQEQTRRLIQERIKALNGQ